MINHYLVRASTLIVSVAVIRGIVSGAIVWDHDSIGHRDTSSSGSKSTTGNISTSLNLFDIENVIELSGELVASPKQSYDPRRAHIDSSSGHLDMRMYDITYNRAKLPLVQLAESGLPIRIILENDKYSSFGNSYVGTKALFEDVGIKILSDSDLGLGTNYVHAKVFVTPDRAMIQTANLTNGGFNTSREYYIYLTNQVVVNNIQTLFDADWKGKPLLASQIHPNILVCPIDCRSKIYSLINSATKSIIIQNQYVEDPALTQLLASKTRVSKQIIIANNDYSANTLKTFGDDARILTSPYPHAKMMLIDDHYLLISSINYSTNSIDNNREIGVIVTNPEAIEYFKTTFAKDRAKGKTSVPVKKSKS